MRNKIALPVLVNEYSKVIKIPMDGIPKELFSENIIIVDGDNVWFKQPSSNHRLTKISISKWGITFDENNKMNSVGSILVENEYHREHYYIIKNKVHMLNDSWIYEDKINYHQHLDDFGNKIK